MVSLMELAPGYYRVVYGVVIDLGMVFPVDPPHGRGAIPSQDTHGSQLNSRLIQGVSQDCHPTAPSPPTVRQGKGGGPTCRDSHHTET